MKVVLIRGRNRHETRKKTLDYWFSHKDLHGCTMKDFLKKCSTDPSGRVIKFKE